MKKDRVYTDKQKAFLEALLSQEAKGNIRVAMKIAGFSENTTTAEVIASLRDEIIDVAKQALALKATEASFKLGDIMDKPPAFGASAMMKAANSILDRVGIVKPEEMSSIAAEGGIVILPAKKKVQVEITDDGEKTTITMGAEASED